MYNFITYISQIHCPCIIFQTKPCNFNIVHTQFCMSISSLLKFKFKNRAQRTFPNQFLQEQNFYDTCSSENAFFSSKGNNTGCSTNGYPLPLGLEKNCLIGVTRPTLFLPPYPKYFLRVKKIYIT